LTNTTLQLRRRHFILDKVLRFCPHSTSVI
jgi:hypothetical protein